MSCSSSASRGNSDTIGTHTARLARDGSACRDARPRPLLVITVLDEGARDREISRNEQVPRTGRLRFEQDDEELELVEVEPITSRPRPPPTPPPHPHTRGIRTGGTDSSDASSGLPRSRRCSDGARPSSTSGRQTTSETCRSERVARPPLHRSTRALRLDAGRAGSSAEHFTTRSSASGERRANAIA